MITLAKAKLYATIGGGVLLLLWGGAQSCAINRAKALAEKYRVERTEAISSMNAKLAAADQKHAEIIAAQQAEINAAHVASSAAVGKVQEVQARARRDVAAIRASAATWEQKFVALEIKYEADLGLATGAIESLKTENALLVEQIGNYKAAADDYRRLNNEALDRMARLVADNLRISAKYRRAKTWAIGATAATAILATAKLAAKK